jgi:hypothetical protein
MIHTYMYTQFVVNVLIDGMYICMYVCMYVHDYECHWIGSQTILKSIADKSSWVAKINVMVSPVKNAHSLIWSSGITSWPETRVT